MQSKLHKNELQAVLQQDRIWSAYALADLDPEHAPYTTWHALDGAILLRYSGLKPAVLFAQGEPKLIQKLLTQIPIGTYQISFPAAVLDALTEDVKVVKRIRMWRMHRHKPHQASVEDLDLRQLTVRHAPAIASLYQDQPMAPDGYHPRQITIGPFIGAWESNTLIATAGVHVLSKSQGIAAIGNVFTHPDWRRRGVARACLLSLLDKLEPYSPQIVVLNVEQENLAAIRLYQSIGFKIHCQFNEGLILIQ